MDHGSRCVAHEVTTARSPTRGLGLIYTYGCCTSTVAGGMGVRLLVHEEATERARFPPVRPVHHMIDIPSQQGARGVTDAYMQGQIASCIRVGILNGEQQQ